MGRTRRFEGDTLDAALAAASSELGVPERELDFKVIETGRKGVFGLGSRATSIEVELPGHEPRAGRPARDRPEPTKERPKRRRRRSRRRGQARNSQAPSPPRSDAPVVDDEVVGNVQDTVERMLALMALELEVQSAGVPGGVRLELAGADTDRLTRKDCELLLSLQFILNRMSRRAWPDAGRIMLACDGYQVQRDEEIQGLAREVASRVARTGKPQRLHPMNPYERRLVHILVREMEGLTTRSEGSGFLKKVCIRPE